MGIIFTHLIYWRNISIVERLISIFVLPSIFVIYATILITFLSIWIICIPIQLLAIGYIPNITKLLEKMTVWFLGECVNDLELQ